MGVTTVQIVTQAASEGLNAKFSDLCDPHDLNVHSPRKTISKLTTKSRASSKALRQLRKQERGSDFSSTEDEAYLMSLIPLKTEPSLFNIRHTFKLSKLGSPSASQLKACNSPQTKGHGVTRKLLRLCRGSTVNKYTSLPVF